MKRQIVFVAAALLTVAVDVGYAGPTVVTEVKHVRVRPHVAYVLFDGCRQYSKIHLDSEYAKLMMSVALTAGATGKAVEVSFEHTGGCQEAESKLTYLEIQF